MKSKNERKNERKRELGGNDGNGRKEAKGRGSQQLTSVQRLATALFLPSFLPSLYPLLPSSPPSPPFSPPLPPPPPPPLLCHPPSIVTLLSDAGSNGNTQVGKVGEEGEPLCRADMGISGVLWRMYRRD